jgi:hypothetical protein
MKKILEKKNIIIFVIFIIIIIVAKYLIREINIYQGANVCNNNISNCNIVITNVVIKNITESSALVTWDTPGVLVDSAVRVFGGTINGIMPSIPDPVLTVNHSITLTGLAPSTSYIIRPLSGGVQTSSSYTIITKDPNSNLNPNPNPSSNSKILFQDSFSSGINSQFWSTTCMDNSSTLVSGSLPCSVINDPANSTNKIARVEWRPWNKRQSGDLPKKRGGAEFVQSLDPSTTTQYQNNGGVVTEGWNLSPGVWPDNVWLKFKFRLTNLSALDNDYASSVIFFQLHHRDPQKVGGPNEPVDTGISPNPAIVVTTDELGDHISLQLEGKCIPTNTNKGYCKNDSCNDQYCIVYKPITINLPVSDRGKWHEIGLRILFSQEPTGSIQMWFDKVLQGVNNQLIPGRIKAGASPWPAGSTTITNFVTQQNNWPQYIQFGAYVLGWPDNWMTMVPDNSSIIIDFDDFKFAKTGESIGLN